MLNRLYIVKDRLIVVSEGLTADNFAYDLACLPVAVMIDEVSALMALMDSAK